MMGGGSFSYMPEAMCANVSKPRGPKWTRHLRRGLESVLDDQVHGYELKGDLGENRTLSASHPNLCPVLFHQFYRL